MSATHLNRVTIIGNLGRDPESRTFNGGNGGVVNMTVATTQKWKKGEEWQERTEWHRVVVFADYIRGYVMQYAVKGDLVMVEGELRTRKWQDQSGNDRYSTEIVVEKRSGSVRVFDKKGNERSGTGDTTGGGLSDSAGNDSYNDDLDDEIPF